jgi:hypothetical protein
VQHLHVVPSIWIPGVPPAYYFAWDVADPIRREYRCWMEKDWLGFPLRVCGYVDLPQTYTRVTGLGRPLPDGDAVQIRVSAGTPGNVEFLLSVQNEMTWWKGMTVLFVQTADLEQWWPYANQHTGVYGEGNRSPGEPDDSDRSEVLSIPTAALQAIGPNRGAVGLAKAKLFGVHEGTYYITLDEFIQFDGQRVQFHWIYDNLYRFL